MPNDMNQSHVKQDLGFFEDTKQFSDITDAHAYSQSAACINDERDDINSWFQCGVQH